MVRIVHYIGLLEFGGSQSFVMEIYRKIDRTKIQFDFVVFPNQKKDFYNEIIELGGRVFESPQYNGRNHFKFIKWWNEFFLQHTEYKILHCHVRSVAALCIAMAHKRGCYTIAHSHSTSNGSGFLAVIKDIMQYPVRYQADYLFACSQMAGEWMFGKQVFGKNYEIISNAIDAERFDFDESIRRNVRNELGLRDKFVIGHVGRITKPKNHIFLIDLLTEIRKNRSDIVLLLVGDGELRTYIEAYANEKNVIDNIIFLGSKNNTQDYYQAMDVFVFPSLWEGLGIVAIEAQASGLHCVVSERFLMRLIWVLD